jgi:hypothetical protein
VEFGLGFGNIQLVKKLGSLGTNLPRQIVMTVKDVPSLMDCSSSLGDLISIGGVLLGL